MALTKVRGSGLDSSQEGAITFNEGSADVDFRVESNGNTHALFVDAGNDKVGVGTSSPDGALHVKGISDHGRIVLEAGGTSGSDNNMFMQFHNGGGTEIAQIEIGEGASNEGQITFKTGGTTTAMTIDKDGNLLIGKTSTSSTVSGIHIGTEKLTATRSGGSCAAFVRTGSDGSVVDIQNDSSTVGSISVSGSSTAYNTSSDHRLKENIVTDWDATTRLKQLKPSRFNFIADADTTVDGFLAHEVSSIIPEAVTGEKDAVDADGNPEYQGIDQSKLVPLLTKALQEAISEIDTLKEKVTALENA